MWILPDSMYSVSAPVSEDSTLELSRRCLRLEQSVTWRGKLSAASTWLKRWRRLSWIKRLCGRILPHSTAQLGVDEWISSLGESRASRIALPASNSEARTSETSSMSSSESLAKWDPATSSWRMSGGSSLQTELGDLLEVWPSSFSIRRGVLFKRSVLERLRDESDFLFWPTPRTITGGAESAARKRELGRKKAGGGDLQAAAKEWSITHGHRDLMMSLGGKSTSKDILGLSPKFVEALMGFPIGWTVLEP